MLRNFDGTVALDMVTTCIWEGVIKDISFNVELLLPISGISGFVLGCLQEVDSFCIFQIIPNVTFSKMIVCMKCAIINYK